MYVYHAHLPFKFSRSIWGHLGHWFQMASNSKMVVRNCDISEIWDALILNWMSYIAISG